MSGFAPPTEDAREQKDRRSGNPAASILNALNPQSSPAPPSTNLDAARSIRDDGTVVYAPSEGPIYYFLKGARFLELGYDTS